MSDLHWRDAYPPPSEWMTVAEWAEHHEICKTAVNRMIRRGEVQSRTFNKPAHYPGWATMRMIRAEATPPARYLRLRKRQLECVEANHDTMWDPQPGDGEGRDEWCARLARALRLLTASPRPRVTNWRRVLTSIEDCLMPREAARRLGISVEQWLGLRAELVPDLVPAVAALGRELLRRRGLDVAPPSMTINDWAEARRGAA